MWYSKRNTSNFVKVEFDGKYSWAIVLHILLLEESSKEVVMVRWLKEVSDQALNPVLGRLSMVRVVQSSKSQFIPASSVVCTLSHRELSVGALGLNVKSILLIGVNPGEHQVSMLDDLDDMYRENMGESMDLDNDVTMT